MPLSSMVTGTVDGASPRGPQQSDAVGVGREDEQEAERVAQLEARVAELEAQRDQLAAEKRNMVARYEVLLREVQETSSGTERPDDDGLLVRVARRLGLR